MKEMRLFLLLLFIILGFSVERSTAVPNKISHGSDFPSEFVFGAGTSAYQYEGAAAEDGRSPSIWDTYTHAGQMPDKSNADVAVDGYHKYKEDVKLMKDTALEAYKFSISWSRLIPNGRGAVNPKGLKYYNNVIDELVQNGIQPHVTLHHLDLPQALEEEYGGWLRPKIIDDFKEYADVCFRNFGDRVSHWTTVQEPNVFGQASYDTGIWPPERCSYPFGARVNCSAGNSTVEPYIVVHNILLAHATVVNLYRTMYQPAQKGCIGLNVYTVWFAPFSNSSADIEAARRTFDFMIGWIIHPIVYGEYPKTMKENAGNRLPCFSEAEAKLLKGAFDFIGLNHYTSAFVKDTFNARPIPTLRDYTADMFATVIASRNETPGGQYVPIQTLSDPAGFQKMLEYLKLKYGNPPIYIQENGYRSDVKNELNDTDRINYLSDYIGSMLNVIRDGSDVRGYFVWSFLDVFELLGGYQARYGLYYVDLEDSGLKRKPRHSAHWYSSLITEKNGANLLRPGPQELSHIV